MSTCCQNCCPSCCDIRHPHIAALTTEDLNLLREEAIEAREQSEQAGEDTDASLPLPSDPLGQPAAWRRDDWEKGQF